MASLWHGKYKNILWRTILQYHNVSAQRIGNSHWLKSQLWNLLEFVSDYYRDKRGGISLDILDFADFVLVALKSSITRNYDTSIINGKVINARHWKWIITSYFFVIFRLSEQLPRRESVQFYYNILFFTRFYSRQLKVIRVPYAKVNNFFFRILISY